MVNTIEIKFTSTQESKVDDELVKCICMQLQKQFDAIEPKFFATRWMFDFEFLGLEFIDARFLEVNSSEIDFTNNNRETTVTIVYDMWKKK